MIDSSEIKEKERELDQLKKEYMAEREPCMNTTCTLYNKNHKNLIAFTDVPKRQVDINGN